jgi:hypothetical protein
VREAFLALQRTEVPAPVAGQVAKRTVQVGPAHAPGAPLMSVVPLDQVWVEANFKEVQLRRMRIGQPVTLHADLYGTQVAYKGRVAGLGAGTGAAFALLPAQNATGNWIKVVQRVPVRIGSIDAKDLAAHPLRVGLSMQATVDVAAQQGQPLAAAASAPRASSSTDVFKAAGDEAEPRVRRSSAPSSAGPCADERHDRRRFGAPAPEPPPPQRPPAFAPLQGSERVLGTLALSLATFMNVLDTSIANVSLPAIAGDMGVSPAQGTWVITSFAVANAIAVPLTGWLTQRFGQVRLFVMSVLLFVLASWLCGLAPNLESLIAARAAGPGGRADDPAVADAAAGQLPAGAGRHRDGAVGHDHAGGAGHRAAAGRLDHRQRVAWPWIFYINVPVGLFAAALTWSIYRSRDPGPRRVPLDSVGLVLLVLWVGALQLMVDKGKELDWFESTEIVVLAVVAVVGLRPTSWCGS